MSVLRAALWRVTEPLNRMLDFAERHLARRDRPFPHPPVFIIGSPRSGSTLLYQVLVAAFRFGYLTNLHCRFYGGPVLVQRLGNTWLRGYRQDHFDSADGQTRGLRGPSECGRFWYRWFPRRPQYVTEADVRPADAGSLREVLLRLTELWDAPLLFKNLTCGMRLRVLAPLLPEAVFIVIRRDPLWTAQSLLHGRERLFGDARHWWSTEPPDVDVLRALPPEEQVVRQVASIYTTIDADAGIVGASRFLSVGYEELCGDVPGTVARVRAFLAARGARFPDPPALPARLDRVERTRLPATTMDRLRAIVRDVFAPAAVAAAREGRRE